MNSNYDMNKKLIEAALKSLEMGNNVQISKTECRRLWSYAKSVGYEQNSDSLILTLADESEEQQDAYLTFKELDSKRMQVTYGVLDWAPVESTQPPWNNSQV